MGWMNGATTGDWEEFSAGHIETYISELSHNPDLDPAHELAARAARQFENDKSEVASLLSMELSRSPDPYLESLKEELDKLHFLSKAGVIDRIRPSGQSISRDSLAVTQGSRTPPHIAVLAEVYALRQPKIVCERLSSLARKAGSHIGRKSRRQRAEPTGTNVFIGHGRSLLWRELKDFIEGRLRLPWDEFNRVPVAGITNIARLSEMLDAAAIAFLLVTGEDELQDGTVQARMNVVHEAGLFQGKARLHEGDNPTRRRTEEFSNIQGLGQIRFPKGNIQATFEDVRRVLEREEILAAREEAQTS